MPSSQAAPVNSTPQPPTDSLKLPLPPLTLHFAVRGDACKDSFYQRYLRKGDSNDATSAVIGKGGFGTAYRYVRDDSFTPPTSVLETTVSSADCDLTGSSEMSKRRSNLLSTSDAKMDLTRSVSANNMRASAARGGSVPPSPPCGTTVIKHHPRNKAPAVVVVKVCRTPTSGSYDELPKTGIGRTEAKIAAQEIATGTPNGEHTRIVRGEARLLRYLQMCQAMEEIKAHKSHCVRLLADIPMFGGRGDDESEESSNGPPIPRLLVFERLVDLDAELTSRGWSKSKQVWSVEKVENTAKDAIAGLKFLHSHAIVHGDLKPSNFMRDARTGAVKLIDLGASRRWVRLHNLAKERTTAVEELDQAVQNGQIEMQRPEDILCEGLGSLTGSPHFMAPEVLLQAGRYLSSDGMARNVLDDYVTNKNRLPRHPSTALLSAAHRDFKRGWGIKADVWSWGCSLLSLTLRTLDPASRPSSSTVCAFDFSFETDADALQPLWPLHTSNDSLPRFHQWARLYGLRIMSVVERGVALPSYSECLSSPFLHMLQAAFYHVDSRPSAAMVLEYLDAHTGSNVEYMSEIEMDLPSRAPSRAQSIARSVTSASSVQLSMPDEPHNIDVTPSTSFMTSKSSLVGELRLNASEVNLNLPSQPVNTRIAIIQDQSNSISRQSNNALASSPLISPGTHQRSFSPLNTEGRNVAAYHRPTPLMHEAKGSSSRRSSFSSEMANVTKRAEDAISVSPSIQTQMTTPLMETILPVTPKQQGSLNKFPSSPPQIREDSRSPSHGRERTESLSSVHSNGNLMADHRPGRQTLKGKVSRTSIFSRMASSMRLQPRNSTIGDSRIPMHGGEQTARPRHTQTGTGTNDAGQSELLSQMEGIEQLGNSDNHRGTVSALGLHLGASDRSNLRPTQSQFSLRGGSEQGGLFEKKQSQSNHRTQGSISNSMFETRGSPMSQYFTGDSTHGGMQNFNSLQQQPQNSKNQRQRNSSVPQSLRLHLPESKKAEQISPPAHSAATMVDHQGGSFLQHDPAQSVPHTAPLDQHGGDRHESHSTRRQRSWSAFFRRNKKFG